ILGRVDAGYVLFVYPPYRVEVTMFFFALAAAASFAILYAGVRLLGQILALPATVRAYRARRRRERAHGALAAALQAYYEGRYRRAERQAALAFEIGPAPGLAALLAARAAHQMRNFEDRDGWLERAPAEEYKVQANVELLGRSADDTGAFERRWRAISERDQLHPRVAAAAARHATALGLAALAREILEKALAAEWSSRLIGLYA